MPDFVCGIFYERFPRQIFRAIVLNLPIQVCGFMLVRWWHSVKGGTDSSIDLWI